MLPSAPKLALLSEFGEELVGHRAHLAQAMADLVAGKLGRTSAYPVLPADVDLCLDLKTNAVKCTKCEEWHPYGDITAIERETDSIGYVSAHAVDSSQKSCQWK
jgi:NAD-dependent dihydropyrimidine dehydrogenase PreA subunit